MSGEGLGPQIMEWPCGRSMKTFGQKHVCPPAVRWCLALHGNHDEHQCHKKPGHRENVNKLESRYPWRHECYCGVVW